MLKYMWNKNKVLMKITITVIFVILVMGTLMIIDSVQKARIEANSVTYELQEDDGEIRAYNVDGLTEEQIQEWLERERAERLNKGE